MIKRRNRGGGEDKDDFLSSSFAPLRIGKFLRATLYSVIIRSKVSMASFSISPDRMTLTLFLFFHTFFYYILSSLSFFLSFRFRVFSFFYNLIDRIRSINSHVRIIHQGYRSHVSRWFCRNLKFSFSTFQSFHSSWNFIIGELFFFFFFFQREWI